MTLLIGASRVLFAMSRDWLLPPSFGKVNHRTGTPVRITVTIGTLVALAAALTPVGTLEFMVNIGTLAAFTLVSIAVPVLRVKRPDMQRPFRTPLSPVLPVVSGICCVLLMSNPAVETWLRFLVWLVLGLIIYVGYSRTHARLADPARFDALVTDEKDVTATPRD
jgi:APA family basic amino acid/polyamine antiporter